MDKITLKNTDLTVSRLCFGTMTFGKQADETESGRLIDCCFDHGVNFIDTANIYERGLSETILGKILAGRRKEIVLASKVRGKMGEGPDESGLSGRAMMRAIEESLARLKTDYLDIYYLHMPDRAVPIEESLETMDRLIDQGKVRYAATSNYSGWEVCRMLWLAEQNELQSPYISQPMYNLLARGIEQEYLPMCRELGVSTVIYNPLAGGLLTGKQKREAPLEGTRFDNNQLYLDRYWHPAYFDAVEELRAVAQRAGRSLVSLSLNWLLHHTAMDCAILGASRLGQFEENLQASEEGPLDEATLAGCDAVWEKLRGVTPKYNR